MNKYIKSKLLLFFILKTLNIVCVLTHEYTNIGPLICDRINIL
jgi:hypothetical protein